MKRLRILITVLYSILLINTCFAQTGDWETITNQGIIHRHESSFVECNGKFYLIGGRRLGLEKYTNIYDPAANTWTKGTNKSPVELHHFQAVSFNGKIYIIGAFTGGHPAETPVDKIYIYNPADDTWSEGGTVPADRRRGASGAVVYNNKIYIIGGATNGHLGGNVSWLDEYDPATGAWTSLADAPRARDHFQAVISGNKLYIAGGRMSRYVNNQNADVLIYEVDVYDFTAKAWQTYQNNLPTGRAGTASVVLNNELLVIGGESSSQLIAHNQTEAMNLNAHTWRALARLDTGRHATHAINFNNKVYIVSGSKSRGGSNSSELYSMEVFSFEAALPNELSMPSEINFGEVPQTETKTETITIVNSAGNNSITITSIDFSNNPENEFFIESPPSLPYVLTGGSSLSLVITFDPASAGEKNAALNIQHTGANNPGNIVLRGESILGPTGTQESNLFRTVIIYPNPGRSQVMIDNIPEALLWEIRSTSGIVLSSGETDFVNNHNLDISNLITGVYILTIRDKKQNTARSFLLKKE
ncbi:MAG: choice-of-anchor D domain-containing protein [Cytophagaceae bacterium]|nr:choice-of-anchor D domain-containing protein [Cytophagaceae bacterium]